MKMLLTLGLDGDPGDFSKAVQAELSDLVARGGAQRGALDVRAAGDELDTVRELDTEHDASAMVSLWGVEAPATALASRCPTGAGWWARTRSTRSCNASTTAPGPPVRRRRA